MKEKLNLWDRFFNRYTKTVHDRGQEVWFSQNFVYGQKVRYIRNWVEYKITDRLTGSETIKREYLN